MGAIFPEWKKLAAAVSPSIKIAQVDADQHKDLAGHYKVEGFPTIKFMAPGKEPVAYNGGRTAIEMAKYALQALGDLVVSRLGGKPSSGGSSSRSGGGSKKGPSQVVNLNESDFKSKVMGGKDDWLVAFTAPWCGHCVKLHPEWVRGQAAQGGLQTRLGRRHPGAEPCAAVPGAGVSHDQAGRQQRRQAAGQRLQWRARCGGHRQLLPGAHRRHWEREAHRRDH